VLVGRYQRHAHATLGSRLPIVQNTYPSPKFQQQHGRLGHLFSSYRQAELTTDTRLVKSHSHQRLISLLAWRYWKGKAGNARLRPIVSLSFSLDCKILHAADYGDEFG